VRYQAAPRPDRFLMIAQTGLRQLRSRGKNP
jgi:hypothetical protein